MYVSVPFQATRDPICCITATDKTLIVVCTSLVFIIEIESCNKMKSKIKVKHCLFRSCVLSGPGVWHYPQIQPPKCCAHPEIHFEQQSLLSLFELQLQASSDWCFAD